MYSILCVCKKKNLENTVVVKSKTLISGSLSLCFHTHTFRKKEKSSLTVKISIDAKEEWITYSLHEAKYVGIEHEISPLNSYE